MDGDKVFVLVEGDDDETFFSNIIEPRIYDRFENIKYWHYSQKEKKGIKKFVKSLNEMEDDISYLFLADRDEKDSVEDKIAKLVEEYEHLTKENTYVAEIDIESWYFAGLEQEVCDEFNITYFGNTSNKGKDYFKQTLPCHLYRNNNFKKSFLIKITKNYSLDEARSCNSSFDMFCKELGL